MSGKTTYDAIPKLVQFDRDLCSLSAATIDHILTYIGTDRLRVHRDIVWHKLLKYDRRRKDEAWSHALMEVVEFARAKGDQFRELVTNRRWRYFFSGIAHLQFQSTRSTWHREKTRQAEMVLIDDQADPQDPIAEVEDLIDLVAIASPEEGHEAEMSRFLANLSLLMREVPWYYQRLFAIYHFDFYQWLPALRAANPKVKMTYRLIQEKTGIPHQTVQGAVQHVMQHIRDHYAERFKEPIPRHLLRKL